jgi:hypothetical protein
MIERAVTLNVDNFYDLDQIYHQTKGKTEGKLNSKLPKNSACRAWGKMPIRLRVGV